MKKILFFGFVAIIMVILTCYYILYNKIIVTDFVKKGKKVENKKLNQYSVFGIDVSHYQGHINWKHVANENVAFCFMKATEGFKFVDKRFHYNIKEAKKHNILVGAYHYYRFNQDNNLQFKNLKNVVNKDIIDLPVVVDVELCNNPMLRDYKSRDKFRNDLSIFLSMIESHYGKKPLIYCDVNMYKYLLKNKIDNQLWIAEYRAKSIDYLDSTQWVFWQHSYQAKKKGINGNVDLNVFNGSINDLKTFNTR